MRMTRCIAVLCLAAVLGAGQAALAQEAPSAANVRLAALFTDNMVLQRDMPVHVWGWADPGGVVEVSVAGQSARATAGRDGKWVVQLPALPAGGPHEMTIVGQETRTLKDVLVGEVWFGSGQSNMQMPVLVGTYGVQNAEQEIAGAAYPNIRLFTVPMATSDAPKTEFEAEGWKPCSPETVPPFSAALYFFGRELHKRLDVPIGLIHTSWGGTPAEAWTSREGLAPFPEFHQSLDTPTPDTATLQREFDAKLAEWEKGLDTKDAGMPGGQPAWADPALDTADWQTLNLPAFWEDAGFADFDGFMWFRKDVELPEAWAGKDATLQLGPINDREQVWFNGEQLKLDQPPATWETPRAYPVPGRLVKAGRNVVAIRVYDMGNRGGFGGKPEDLRVEAAGLDPIPLAGPWLAKPGLNAKEAGAKPVMPAAHPQHTPARLYNAMIAPIVPYTMRGAIWYQGESNAGRAYQYRTLFPAMIEDWRAKWGQGPFPFYFVQLANFDADKQSPAEPADNPWAELREAQTMTLALPNTGMAVAIDIGNSTDIHPKNKQEVGRRLALAALHDVYGQDLVYSGPMYKEMKAEDGKIRLTFDHVDGGLVAKDGELKGFAVAGEDKKFVWADARIDGDTVVVSSPQVPNPVAVRYGWSDDPVISLFNKEGLPASPFRTDDWPGVTQGK